MLKQKQEAMSGLRSSDGMISLADDPAVAYLRSSPLGPAFGRYVLLESLIAGGASGLISLAFVYLLFGSRSVVALAGNDGIILDAVPQAFMVVLMSCIVSSLVMRRRVASAGIFGFRTDDMPGIGQIYLYSVAASTGFATVSTALQAYILPLASPAIWSFVAVLLYKVVVGATLGAIAAVIALRFCARHALRSSPTT